MIRMPFKTSFVGCGLLVASLLASASAKAESSVVQACLAANESSIAARKAHKLRAARADLLVCAAATCPNDIQKECLRRVDEVSSAIPYVVFQAVDLTGHDLSEVRVSMDGEPLAEHLEGIALAVDPGPHTFRFEAPSAPVVEKQLTIRERDHDRHERIELATADSQRQVAAIGSPSKPVAVIAPPAERAPARGSSRSTYAALALTSAGVGVVGLGVGTIFGLKSIARHNSAADVCPADCQDKHGVDLWDEARSAGNIATVGFIVGGVGLVGAATLWFVVRPEESRVPTAQLRLGPNGLSLRGTW
jgi:hypothetical protein